MFNAKFLEGKTALVTGAGRGIGKAVAETLCRHGAQTVLAARSRDQIDRVRDELEKNGGRALAVTCDVSNSQSAEAAVEETLSRFGGLHILVNNAGITKDGVLVRMKNEDWEEVMRVNLFGSFYFSRAAAKIMMKQREGRIINISSVIGLTGNAGQANYAASKAGLLGLTKSMARELGSRGVTVNAVAPGFIQTEMTEKLPEKAKAELVSRIPLGILGTPEDVAGTVLFLASPLARYVTGQVLCVDGGMA